MSHKTSRVLMSDAPDSTIDTTQSVKLTNEEFKDLQRSVTLLSTVCETGDMTFLHAVNESIESFL